MLSKCTIESKYSGRGDITPLIAEVRLGRYVCGSESWARGCGESVNYFHTFLINSLYSLTNWKLLSNGMCSDIAALEIFLFLNSIKICSTISEKGITWPPPISLWFLLLPNTKTASWSIFSGITKPLKRPGICFLPASNFSLYLFSLFSHFLMPVCLSPASREAWRKLWRRPD